MTVAPEPKNDAPRHVLFIGGKGSGERELISPIDIAIDAHDVLYVTEFHAHRVRKLDTQGRPLGSFEVGEYAGGIAVDRAGRVYVAPLLLGRIDVYDTDGNFIRTWGRIGSGQGELDEPGGIAIGPDDSVYVADQSNHRIQRFTPEGRFISQWGGHGSEPGRFGGGGQRNSRLSGPHFLAFDSRPNLYITDSADGRVHTYSAEGRFITRWGDNRSQAGSFGPVQSSPPRGLIGPIGVCVDHLDRIWVSATNNLVQVFSSDGEYLFGLGGDGDGPGQFQLPHGMAFDSHGDLYVVEAVNHRVQKFAL